jgi:hypothetical protein
MRGPTPGISGATGVWRAETFVLREGLLPAPLDVPNDGLSNGNLYPYFENREQLFDCLDEEHFAGFAKPCNSGSPASKTAIRYACSKQASAFYVDFGFPTGTRTSSPSSWAEQSRPGRGTTRRFEYLHAAIRRSVEEKNFRPVDVETTSQVLWAVMHGVTSLLILRPTFR